MIDTPYKYPPSPRKESAEWVAMVWDTFEEAWRKEWLTTGARMESLDEQAAIEAGLMAVYDEHVADMDRELEDLNDRIIELENP